MNKEDEYLFKNSFVFVETGNLKTDLYRAFKDELGYMLEQKYKHYFKMLCDDIGFNTPYYKDLVELLSKLKSVMQDSEVISIKEYFENYEFEKKVGIAKQDNSMKFVFDVLRKFDTEMNIFAYEIMEKTVENNFEKKYGVFNIIRQYFNLNSGKKYSNFQAFLDKNYSFIFESLKLKYGDKYGKKE